MWHVIHRCLLLDSRFFGMTRGVGTDRKRPRGRVDARCFAPTRPPWMCTLRSSSGDPDTSPAAPASHDSASAAGSEARIEPPSTPAGSRLRTPLAFPPPQRDSPSADLHVTGAHPTVPVCRWRFRSWLVRLRGGGLLPSSRRRASHLLYEENFGRGASDAPPRISLQQAKHGPQGQATCQRRKAPAARGCTRKGGRRATGETAAASPATGAVVADGTVVAGRARRCKAPRAADALGCVVGARVSAQTTAIR